MAKKEKKFKNSKQSHAVDGAVDSNVKENKYNRGNTKSPIENSFYSYAELTEEQKIRFAAYQVFDMPKKASSNIKDTDSGKPEVQE